MESSLFILTKKCFKICGGIDSKYFNQQEKSKLFYIDKKDEIYKETIDFFDICMARCAYDYAKYRSSVRKNFLKDISDV